LFYSRKEHQHFKNYGEGDVLLLAKHFAANDVDQFLAEWHRFKFDLIDFQGVGYEPVTAMKG